MNAIDRFFKISERGSTIGQEVMAGLTTFLSMAYIIAVNPAMLVEGGMSFSAALTATCFGAAITTLFMGLFANRPIALASGMGINAVVTYTLCVGLGCDWRVAMAVVFVSGIITLILVLCGLRKAIMDAIPVSLRLAIGIGIGLFIAFIGMQGGGVIVLSESTLVTIGDFTSPEVILSLISIALSAVLMALNVKFGLIISIVVCVIIGIPMGVTPIPTDWSFGLDFSAFAAPFQIDPDTSVMAIVEVFASPILLCYVFTILMSDFFDTLGGIVAIGEVGGFTDEKGDVEDMQKILIVDSTGAALGGFMGASSITSFAESATGCAQGAKTGLSNVVIAICFILCSFLSPLASMVSSSATCGALTVVGFLMLKEVGKIEWDNFEVAFPAFLTIMAIPMTYSITYGIGLGFISYVVIKIFKGEAKEVKPLMWIASIAFLIMFILL